MAFGERPTTHDDELVRRAIDGDTLAFTRLVQAEAERVFRFALNMLGNADEAEAVLRETCVEASREVRFLPSPERFGLWFLHVAIEACLRRASAPAPRRTGVRSIPAHVLAAAPLDRLAFLLRDVEALSWEDVTWILDEPVTVARARVHRVRMALCPVVGATSSANERLRVVA